MHIVHAHSSMVGSGSVLAFGGGFGRAVAAFFRVGFEDGDISPAVLFLAAAIPLVERRGLV